ncbi:MAG: ubiquinol-cytochrome c reductase iron-sulfur subunit [Nitrospirota bacterium]|nr:MAG: ubiquinol-cytochrome c reductase iron-sulfur subunit [Nitrospirota bacterium]
MERRNFLRSFLTFLGSLTLVSFVYPAARFLYPTKQNDLADKVVLHKKDVAPGSSLNITLDNKPVIVVHRRNQGFIALSRVCTHLGCLVRYDRGEDRIICPCHAAQFNLEGNVISGPAPRPLERIPLQVKSEKIYIG